MRPITVSAFLLFFLLACPKSVTPPGPGPNPGPSPSPDVQPTIADIKAPLIEIAVGGDFGCALSGTNRVFCWGESGASPYTTRKQVSDPFPAGGYKLIAGGGDPVNRYCLVRQSDDKVVCFRQEKQAGEILPIIKKPVLNEAIVNEPIFAHIAAASQSGCALTTTGQVRCFAAPDFPPDSQKDTLTNHSASAVAAGAWGGLFVYSTTDGTQGTVARTLGYWVVENGFFRPNDDPYSETADTLVVSQQGSYICDRQDQGRPGCYGLNKTFFDNDSGPGYTKVSYADYSNDSGPADKILTDLEVSDNFACGVKKGILTQQFIQCWSHKTWRSSYQSLKNAVAKEELTHISVSADILCGIKKNGRAICYRLELEKSGIPPEWKAN